MQSEPLWQPFVYKRAAESSFPFSNVKVRTDKYYPPVKLHPLFHNSCIVNCDLQITLSRD